MAESSSSSSRSSGGSELGIPSWKLKFAQEEQFVCPSRLVIVATACIKPFQPL